MAIEPSLSSPVVPPSTAGAPGTPRIRLLTIKHFRGVDELSWHPGKSLNVILGGGDVGKTTILEAIALLLSPTNAVSVSDTDYYMRNVDDGFSIEGVFTLPPESGINYQLKESWPWEWSGTQAVVPTGEGEGAKGEAVYCLRVRGTEDLELTYEIVQPDGTADILPVALRRGIGLVRLGGDDRSDRDLRLVQGSALDRLLSDKTLRSRIATKLAQTEVEEELSEDAKKALEDLDDTFEREKLPDCLELSVTGSPGASIASMIGLTAFLDADTQLPLSSWGAGTRRLAALTIAAQNQGEHPITVVDEIERGLEPYRQRVLIGKLQNGKSQAFVTTHSPAAIAAASAAALWYIAHDGKIGPLDDKKIAAHRAKDPDTFLSRLTIIGEGVTEVGFCKALLERALEGPLQQHGIHVSDGNGNDNTLDVLEALVEGGLRFGGFADDEQSKPQRWAKVLAAQGALVFRWKDGCVEENVMRAVPDAKLEELLQCPKGEKTGDRLRTLADRLNVKDKAFKTISVTAGANLKQLMIDAAKGTVPADKQDEKKQYKAHCQRWFKTEEGGRELMAKVFSLGVWPVLKAELLPFCNAVRKAVELDEIADVKP
jgi:putative ATP-dependent endonuclease of OLD family